ncbi:MAG: hypothetical protein GXY36_02155 [Chloroflexi bacterium]|mgnify:CR=1 FL=1|jgi:hypothetical protein|nr:hypothetical protein [Chloroflexota bacterium]
MTTQSTPNRPGRLSGLKTRLGILGELFSFLWAAKMWWLIPMIIALIIFAIVIVFGSASGGGPLIYTLF